MNGIWLILIAGLAFLFAYRFYGSFLAGRFSVDAERSTPAHTQTDGVDYMPAKTPVLLGHHFASIAGAGPIVGPIIAATFGWLPVFLWIVIGSVFFGGVHDYAAIVASLRHKGKSIGQIIEKYIGLSGKKLFLIFSWSTLILVIAVFTNIVADTFYRTPSSATSSLLFIGLAILFGVSIYRLKINFWLSTVLGIALLFASIFIGEAYPLHFSKLVWQWVLMGYIFVASVTPVWILLQPRDYLNSFLLYALMAGGLIGVFFAAPDVNLAPITQFTQTNLGTLFPILFVTVACGAISGFHSLVGSGTTSKQLNKETDAKLVGYGSMLIEGVLAVLALLAVASLGSGEFSEYYQEGHFVSAFSMGVGRFIHSIPMLNIPVSTATTFSALAVAAFALTTLDTATRLARFALQELFESPAERDESGENLLQNRFISTSITVAVAILLTFSGGSQAIWPIFGSANQLLAALALLAVSVWFLREGKPAAFALIPTFFMFAVTYSALFILLYVNLLQKQNFTLAGLAIILIIFASILIYQAYRQLQTRQLVTNIK